MVERKAANLSHNWALRGRSGGSFPAGLGRGGWGLLSPEQTSVGGASGRRALPPFPGPREPPGEGGLALRAPGGEDVSMNRLMSPGVSPPSSSPWGGKWLQGKRSRCRLGRRAKCLSARCPRTLVRARPEPLFSLTVGLQLVGKLEEEVLVVDDLELAHIRLGLQVMRGGFHIEAQGPAAVFADCPHLFSH